MKKITQRTLVETYTDLERDNDDDDWNGGEITTTVVIAEEIGRKDCNGRVRTISITDAPYGQDMTLSVAIHNGSSCGSFVEIGFKGGESYNTEGSFRVYGDAEIAALWSMLDRIRKMHDEETAKARAKRKKRRRPPMPHDQKETAGRTPAASSSYPRRSTIHHHEGLRS